MAEYDGSIRINTKIETKGVTSQMQKIVNSIKKSESEIQRLQARMNELANMKLPTSEYAKLQKDLDTTIQKYEQVKDTVDNFTKIGTDPKATPFRMARDEAQELYMKIEDIRGAMFQMEDAGKAFIPGTATDEYTKSAAKVRELSDNIEVSKLRLSELQAKQKPVTEEFDRMKKSVNKLASMFGTVGTLGKKAFSALKNSAKKAFLSISSGSKTSGGLLSAFSKRLKSIASAVFVFNLIGKAFDTMISGMKTGFTNFMNYSGDFANSVQSMKNAMNTLGNQIAAAFAPIVQMVIPWFTQLINVISVAMSYVAQFIAALTGKSTFIKAKQVQDSYNKSLGGTAAAAKKAYGALAKFDDLDVLQKKDDDAAGGAGNAIGDLFEEVPIDNSFKDLVKWLKDMWENSDFYELGKFLGEKLKEALENIPWDKIKAAARKLGKSLATLINGFIEVEDLGYLIGKTLSEAMNTAFEFLNTFVHELHWYSIGKFIAEELNGFFETIDWDLIRDTFVTGFRGLEDAINSFIKNFNWNNISNTISNAINIIAETVYTFFTTVEWDKLGQELGEQLRKTIEKIDWEEIGRALGSIVQSALDFLLSFIHELDFGDIAQTFMDVMKGFFEEVDAGDLASIILTAISLKLVTNALTFSFGNVASAIFDGIATASTTTAAAGAAATIIGVLAEALTVAAAAYLEWEVFIESLDEIGSALDRNAQQVETIQDKYRGLPGLINGVTEPFNELGRAMDGLPFADSIASWDALNQAMQKANEGYLYSDEQMKKMQETWQLSDEDMEMLRQSMLDANPALRNLADGFGLFDASAETLADISDGMKMVEDGTISASNAFEAFSDPLIGMTDEAKSFFQSVSDGKITLDDYRTKLGETSETVNEFAASMEEAGENIAEGVTQGFEKADVQTPVQNFFSRVKDTLASVLDMHSPARNMEPDGENVFLGILEGFKNRFSDFRNVISELMQNIQTFITSGNTQLIGIEMGNGIIEGFQAKLQELYAWLGSEFMPMFIEEGILPWFSFEKWHDEILINVPLAFRTMWEELLVWWNDGAMTIWWEEYVVPWFTFDVWKLQFDNILLALEAVWEEVLEYWKKSLDMWWENDVKPRFTLAKWMEMLKPVDDAYERTFTEILNTINSKMEEAYNIVVEWTSQMIAAIQEVMAAIDGMSSSLSYVSGMSFSVSGASIGANVASYSLENIPHLASGSVIRGGNPFLAMLGDQPHGQTNIEAPASLIKDMVREGIREELGNYQFGGGQLKVVMQVNGTDLAQVTLNDFLSEMGRQGYDIDVIGVT